MGLRSHFPKLLMRPLSFILSILLCWYFKRYCVKRDT